MSCPATNRCPREFTPIDTDEGASRWGKQFVSSGVSLVGLHPFPGPKLLQYVDQVFGLVGDMSPRIAVLGLVPLADHAEDVYSASFLQESGQPLPQFRLAGRDLARMPGH